MYIRTACAPDAATNGRLCSFNSRNGGSTTAVYVPDAARGANPLSLIVWIHGLLVCGGEGPDAVSYLKSKTFPLTRQIAGSKRPFVLVVPTMNWRGGQNSHPLGSPQKMNAFLDEVRAGLTAAGWSSPPSFGRLILAGHSKAYAVLNGLAAGVNEPESSQGALATLTDMWLLDSTYGTLHKESLSAMWLKWAKAKGNVNLRILYRRNSDTAPVAERIRDEAARAGQTNVAVEDFDPRSLGHCEMPRVRMPYLLAGAGGRAPGSTGASVPRPTPLPRRRQGREAPEQVQGHSCARPRREPVGRLPSRIGRGDQYGSYRSAWAEETSKRGLLGAANLAKTRRRKASCRQDWRQCEVVRHRTWRR